MSSDGNNENAITRIVIVGGGTAGWMTAAALANFLDTDKISLVLVESDQIGTVGVGEATLPHLRFFNQTLGIDENAFMQATHATYKIGIEFSHWGRKGDSYIHPFGDYGKPVGDIGFHHVWRYLQMQGYQADLSEFSLPVIAAQLGRFDYPDTDMSQIGATFSYAFHLDAGLYAKYLREFSEARGIQRKEGRIQQVQLHPDGGIAALSLDGGEKIEGDFFIDCSGFRSLLLGNTLGVEFCDWSHWLPCDRAIAIPCAGTENPLPYTKAIARDSGWQWRIPLQHRIGNGHVYCSQHLSDDEALAQLTANLDGEPLAEPNFIQFKAGHRVKTWEKNCVAVGLSGGFLEPLESTSIYLIQIAITKLLENFPGSRDETSVMTEFNRQMTLEFERIRDFLILHYHATTRDDTPFWQYCRTMAVPEDLAYKMELFKQRGHVVEYEHGLFLEPSWVAVYLGQGVVPEGFDPRVSGFDFRPLETQLEKLRNSIRAFAEGMPLHSEAIQKYCFAADAVVQPAAHMNLYGRS